MAYAYFLIFLVVVLIAIKILFVIRNKQTINDLTKNFNQQGMEGKAKEDAFRNYAQYELYTAWIDYISANNQLSYDNILEKAHTNFEEASRKSNCIDFYDDNINQIAEKLAAISFEEQQTITDNFQVKLIFKEFATLAVDRMEKKHREQLEKSLRTIRSHLH